MQFTTDWTDNDVSMSNRMVQICSCPIKLKNCWQAQNFLKYLGQKHYKKAINKIKYFIYLGLANPPQRLSS